MFLKAESDPPPPCPEEGGNPNPDQKEPRGRGEGSRGAHPSLSLLLVRRRALGEGRCRAAGAAPRPPPSSSTASARPQGGARKSSPETITLNNVLNTDFIVMATILIRHNFTATPIGSWVAPSIQFATPQGDTGYGRSEREFARLPGRWQDRTKK